MSNNKSFLQRKTCTEERGSAVEPAELVFLKALKTEVVISVYCRVVRGSVCLLVQLPCGEKRNKHKDTHTNTHRGKERENKPLHFQLNHIKHSVNCNAAAEASS